MDIQVWYILGLQHITSIYKVIEVHNITKQFNITWIFMQQQQNTNIKQYKLQKYKSIKYFNLTCV